MWPTLNCASAFTHFRSQASQRRIYVRPAATGQQANARISNTRRIGLAPAALSSQCADEEGPVSCSKSIGGGLQRHHPALIDRSGKETQEVRERTLHTAAQLTALGRELPSVRRNLQQGRISIARSAACGQKETFGDASAHCTHTLMPDILVCCEEIPHCSDCGAHSAERITVALVDQPIALAISNKKSRQLES